MATQIHGFGPNGELSPGAQIALAEFAANDDARLSDARTPTVHDHQISDVTNLQAALDGKAAASHELRGTGMPNGVVTASPGTYYTDTAGTNGAWRWLKKTGTGNTGWECVIGDTGLRNAASLLTSGITGYVNLRRVGSIVFVSGQPTGTAGGEILVLPSGFRTRRFDFRAAILHITGGGPAPGRAFTADTPGESLSVLGAGVGTAPTTASSWQLGFSYPTIDPWPTTLPGTAA